MLDACAHPRPLRRGGFRRLTTPLSTGLQRKALVEEFLRSSKGSFSIVHKALNAAARESQSAAALSKADVLRHILRLTTLEGRGTQDGP